MQYAAAAARVQQQKYVFIVSPKPVLGMCPCRPAQHAHSKSETHVRRKMNPYLVIEATEAQRAAMFVRA